MKPIGIEITRTTGLCRICFSHFMPRRTVKSENHHREGYEQENRLIVVDATDEQSGRK
jgi:hypothetical protein